MNQKTVAAIDEGAELFIVPRDEYAAAKEMADGRIRVAAVDDLDDALKVLRPLGGDAGKVTTRRRRLRLTGGDARHVDCPAPAGSRSYHRRDAFRPARRAGQP